MTRFIRVGVPLLLSLGLVGCGAASVRNETIDSPPSASGAAVNVDSPCTDIDDATLRSLGLNPTSRRSLPPGPNQVSACSFSSGDLDLTVALSRTSFEDFKANNRGISEGMDFGPRPARMVRRPGKDGACEMALKSPDGIVLLTTMITVAAREWGMDQCGGMKQIARTIEPTLGPH